MFWLVLLAFGGNPALAAEGDDERAKELFRNGRDLYDNGRFEAAIDAWKAAYELSDKPLLLFNLADAYERLARYEEALDSLTKYRAFAPAGEGDTLDARIANLEMRVAEERRRQEADEAERRAREAELEAERQKAADLARQQEALQKQAEAKRGAPVAPIVVTTSGAVLTGFGLAMGAGVSSIRSDLRDPTICADNGICKTAARDDLRTQATGGVITDFLLLSGVAGIGLGSYLFVRHGKKSRGADLWVLPDADGASWGVSGAF